ncbi:hypothetical protein [Paludisphaera soli]|uniref:hypothetical protein n=1 Tax=Paludisphaera soli TaxID=2712865 RepID=UPI0013E9B4BC|nr:hypothetical protein [Paludisphaera soli]
MTNGGLPIEWESISHSARVRKAVEVGRRSRSDPSAARLLRDWSSGGFTQRLLATFACHGSRDPAVLLTMAADPSRTIARIAVSVLCDVGDDDSLLAALRDVPPRRAARALFRLRSSRPDVVDRLVTERATEGDVDAWPLVALGSSAVLERYFDFAAERGGVVFWRRLAVLHSSRAAAEILARLGATATTDGLRFSYARVVISILSDRAPDAALTVVEALRRHVPLASIPLQTLVVRRPVAVADLVISSSEPVAAHFQPSAHKLDAARIVGLFRRGAGHLGDPGRWLARLPAPDREAVYRELAPAWTAPDGLVAATVLRRLPAATRREEARRVAALPVLATRPLQRLPFVGLMPWDEARSEAKPWLAHPEAENRAAALVALCEAARFDRSRLAVLLELVTARRHEQDPVRSAFLGALSSLPPGRWADVHLTGIAQVIRDALDAGDLSPGSVASLGRLVRSLLPFHPAWAARQLAEVTRERGCPLWADGAPTAEEVRRIAPGLTPIADAWLNREDEGRVVALAASVGLRLPDWPDLVGFLERLVRTGRDHTAAAAMALIARHVPAERERVVTESLANDESWALQSPVMNFLHARRQDLITPFLGQRSYSGRFSSGKVRHVLPLAAGFFRWTDAQQETFAGSLAELASPPSREKDAQVTWDVLFAVRRLPDLPAVGPERLVSLAGDQRPAVRETAVRALGRLDARQGIPELLESLGDARARWAVYALRQALNDLPQSRVLEVMRGVPFAKVTVAKEAVRLAGELGGSAALGWFGELRRQDLHRDVRGALLRALWDHLDRPEAWAILDASVASPDPGVVIGLSRIQADRASDAARDRVADLFRRLLDHPEPTVRVAVLGRLAAQPVPDARRVLLAAMLAKLTSAIPDERTAGLSAALAGATDADAPAFASAFARLLPARRELAASAIDFAAATRTFGRRLLEVRSAVLAAVEADPAVTSLQIRLAAARFSAEPFAGWVLGLVGTARWHASTQVAAWEALCETGRSAEELERAEALWAPSTDPAARWLALQVLCRVASTQGWSEPRRERLQRLREDPSPLVADEAALTFPPEPKHPAPAAI